MRVGILLMLNEISISLISKSREEVIRRVLFLFTTFSYEIVLHYVIISSSVCYSCSTVLLYLLIIVESNVLEHWVITTALLILLNLKYGTSILTIASKRIHQMRLLLLLLYSGLCCSLILSWCSYSCSNYILITSKEKVF